MNDIENWKIYTEQIEGCNSLYFENWIRDQTVKTLRYGFSLPRECRYPRTTEGLLDWIVRGKPAFFRKLKVKAS